MTLEAIKFINEKLSEVIPYEFNLWTDEITYPYWVGEVGETQINRELGEETTSVFVTGTTKGSFSDLEKQKSLIEKVIPRIDGAFKKVSDSHIIRVYFNGCSPTPTDNNNIKRLQITLEVKEWRL